MKNKVKVDVELKIVVDNLPFAVLMLDRERRILHANPQAELFTRQNGGELEGGAAG